MTKMLTFLFILGLTTIIEVCGEDHKLAFTVGHTSHLDVNDNFTVPFDKIIIDHNGQLVNGVFTCPESGLYEFQVYALTKSGTKLFLELYHNDKLVNSLWAHVANDYASAGNAAILYLDVNDTVQVKTRGNYHTTTFGTADEIYTTFTGIQLGSYENGEYDPLEGFSVALINHQDVAGGAPVIYDTLLTQIPENLKNSYQTNNYNTSTGTYTAPNGGIYIFHFFSLARNDQELWQELYHNDKYVCSLYGLDAGDFADAGNTVVLHLRQGDTIQVRAHPNRPNSIFGTSDEIYSTLTGYELMHENNMDSTDNGQKAYFSAGLSKQSTFQDGERVIFDQVFTDHGTTNHYDHIHGEFTAPYSGIYQFNFHAVGQKGQAIWLELYQNYKYLDSLYSHVPNGYSSAGNTAVVELDAGDVVYVRAHNMNALFGTLGEIYCTFSGVMLHSRQAFHGETDIVG